MEEVLQGKLHNPSGELRNEVATAPTTNLFQKECLDHLTGI